MNAFEEICRKYAKVMTATGGAQKVPGYHPEARDMAVVELLADAERLVREQGDLAGPLPEEQAMRAEVDSAIRIIWCAAKSAGGEIRIPDAVMKSGTTAGRLECHYDVEKEETVYTSAKVLGVGVVLEPGELKARLILDNDAGDFFTAIAIRN